jgi:hypothetical protein
VVFRGTTPDGIETALGVASTASFTDTAVVPGTTYYYSVVAHNAQGDSVASNQAHALIATTLAGGAHLDATPDGTGYWVVGPTGSVTAYGTAHDHGSELGTRLNGPIVGIAAAPDGQGYWLVAADGGVFTFGDAGFYGSLGSTTQRMPIIGLIANPQGTGYKLVNADGAGTSFPSS